MRALHEVRRSQPPPRTLPIAWMEPSMPITRRLDHRSCPLIASCIQVHAVFRARNQEEGLELVPSSASRLHSIGSPTAPTSSEEQCP